MRRIFATVAIAAAAAFVVAPAFAADDITSTCTEQIKIQVTRISELGSIASFARGEEKTILLQAAARETDAAAKDDAAAKFKAAADKVTDPAKKKAYLEFAEWYTAEAAGDRKFAKELKHTGEELDKQAQQADKASDRHSKFLARLQEKCR